MSILEPEEYPLSQGLKDILLNSARQSGCRLSDFYVKRYSGTKVNLAWDLDDDLQINFELTKSKICLRQTFKGKPEQIPVNWDKELPPALQFSSGVCQLTHEQSNRLIRQFPELPKLPQPSSEGEWKKIGIKILEQLLIPGESRGDDEKTCLSMAVETSEQPKEYEVRDDVSLLSFSLVKKNLKKKFVVQFAIQNKVTDDKVKLVITGDSNLELINDEQKMVYQRERYRFRYVLPVSIASKVRNITVFYPSTEE